MKIITAVASLSGQSAEHYKFCGSLEPVRHIGVSHESNTALARNRQLTAAVRAMPEGWDVCLMLDDDVFMSTLDAKCLCKAAHQEGTVQSALYPTAAGDVRLRIAQDPKDARRSIVLTGAGALAIPRDVLEHVAAFMPELRSSDEQRVFPFARSAPSPDGKEWWSEDQWLCYTLGGVQVSASVTASHKKHRMLRLSVDGLKDALMQIEHLRAKFHDAHA